ncbi:DCC1-like thiol-disulfide oxidoreductase family protein [Pontibacter sp. H259]|uniref:thiol-disulfide oxidoreductase DCC family protein n=1 Tax=Pontibacter sp. H259 TaxID=3133421 RepID=UPI0030BE86AD
MQTDTGMLQDKAIVFYDGTCGFCQASVQFVLKYNRKQNLYFAPLQSGVLQQVVPDSNVPDPVPDAVLFYEDGNLYFASEAALRISRHLNFPLSILSYFRFIPVSFRDKIYSFIARHRYKIAGRHEACMLPEPQQRARFIN